MSAKVHWQLRKYVLAINVFAPFNGHLLHIKVSTGGANEPGHVAFGPKRHGLVTTTATCLRKATVRAIEMRDMEISDVDR